MSNVELNAELDRLGARGRRLAARDQLGLEAAIRHAEIRENRLHRFREAVGRFAARRRQPCGRGTELGDRRGFGPIEAREVEGGRIDKVKLGAGAAAGLDHLVQGRAVLLHQAKDKIAATGRFGEALGIQVDLLFVRFQASRQLFKSVVG